MNIFKYLFVAAYLISINSFAEQVIQTKGKRFIFTRESSQVYKSGDKVNFYDNTKKVSLIAQIQKCNSKKCMAVMLKRRKGFTLAKGKSIYPKGTELSSQAKPSKVAKTKKETQREVSVPKTSTSEHKYAIRGGWGGQNSATVFAEFDYIYSPKWVFGLALSNRIISRDDLEVSGIGYGVRADYHLDSFEKNGFFGTVSLGMASLTYDVVNIDPSVTNFSESETVPYFNIMAGYKMWFNRFYMNFAGGLGYIGYKESFEDPTTGSTFTNPYASMDLALEISLAYPF